MSCDELIMENFHEEPFLDTSWLSHYVSLIPTLDRVYFHLKLCTS